MTTELRTARIAVAIPALNAAPTIGAVVQGARRHLDEIVVVDDGSTDSTGENAREAGARLLVHPRNLGKGRALATAFEDLFSRGFDAVITLDADGQHRPDQIPRFLEASAGDADLILGSRAHLFHRMARVRRTSNRLSSCAISTVAGIRLADVQTGFRLYRRRLIEATGLPEPRFEAESAVVVRAVRLGFRVEAVPIEMDLDKVDGRPQSHYRPLVDSLRIAWGVAHAKLEKLRWIPQRSS